MQNTVSIIAKILTVLAVMAIGAALVLFSGAPEETLKPKTQAAKSRPLEQNLSVEKQIVELLRLGGDGSDSIIDMDARQEFFSDAAWRQYQDYVAWHKTWLANMQATDKSFSGQPVHVTASFRQGSQKLREDESGLKTFFSKGRFLYGVSGQPLKETPFRIEISYTGEETGPIRIRKWTVVFMKVK